MVPNNNRTNMKSTELHRIIARNGWVRLPKKGKGSHARYEKNGRIYTVPFHKGKEINNDFAKKILNDLWIE